MYKGRYTTRAVKRRTKENPPSAKRPQGSRRQRKRYARRQNRLRIALFALSSLIVLYAAGNILDYAVYIMASRRQNQELASLAVQILPQPSETVTVPKSTQDAQDSREDSAHQASEPIHNAQPAELPREKAPITVDFDALKQRSPDIIGWLYCPDTPINYPVMRSKNNLDYIRMLPDGTANDAGSLFLDYRNGADFLTGYSVIYGHNMNNDTMFGSLDGYKRQEYYDQHSTMYLITELGSYRVDLVAGVITTGTSDYYALPMELEAAAQKVADARMSSAFTPPTYPDSETYLLLSTCSYETHDGRFILIGALTEIDNG